MMRISPLIVLVSVGQLTEALSLFGLNIALLKESACLLTSWNTHQISGDASRLFNHSAGIL